MNEDWDVVIVGAGPAGTSAALAALQARPGSRVLVLDRDEFPRDKSCGDAVAPHTGDLLEGLGAGWVLRDRTGVRDLSLATENGSSLQRRMRRPIHVVPRRVLDDRLRRAAEAAGAICRRHRVRSLDVRADGVVIDGEVRAQVVVGADGAESVVRRQLGITPNPDGHVAVAIRGYAPTTSRAARVVAGGRDWPAYAWAFPTGDGYANIGYGQVLRGPALSRAGLLEQLDNLLPDVMHAAVGWRAHRLPLSTRRPAQGPGRVLLTGDAASLVNPMSGEGIFYAVLSGSSAGRAAVWGEHAGAVHRSSMRRRLARHLQATSAAVRLARWPALVRAGLRLAQHDQGVFDWYVDLGLGDGEVRPGQAAAAVRRLLVAGRP